MIVKLSQKPIKPLIIDAVGAFVSFVLLGFVLPRFESLFGLSKLIFWMLSIPPAFFLVFDLFALLRWRNKLGQALRTIATLNVLYCITSLTVAFLHIQELTTLGWIYIFVEVIIVLLLSRLEWKASKLI
ncbi:MAG: hypothetical protein Crog4KO_10470 [Crocinitomicaceae bacterium]